MALVTFVSDSFARENLRGLREKNKTQNLNLKRQRCWLTLRLEMCPCCTENRKIGENVSNNNTVKK